LPQELGRVLGLRYDAELATEAIQRRLGVHRNTIHVRVFRALEQMRNCMSAKGFGAEDLL
jgi:DNA-directed RNA polymerase specialized sigma24 family protein